MIILLIFFSITSSYAESDIKNDLYQEIMISHKPLTYKNAVLYLFTIVDNQQGLVCSVYSPSECIDLDGVPSPKIMNVEHTWPQSEGANGQAKSDLHHIFATSSSTNSIRSSLPFCDVSISKWSSDQSSRGFNEFGEHCFEPPVKHKGNVARALFYFSIRYQMNIDDHQETYLRKWNKIDPVDQDELDRHKKIILLQSNHNPFILKPELVDNIVNF